MKNISVIIENEINNKIMHEQKYNIGISSDNKNI